jgi:hypothetical protein
VTSGVESPLVKVSQVSANSVSSTTKIHKEQRPQMLSNRKLSIGREGVGTTASFTNALSAISE